jgi:hypothetical protein
MSADNLRTIADNHFWSGTGNGSVRQIYALKHHFPMHSTNCLASPKRRSRTIFSAVQLRGG